MRQLFETRVILAGACVALGGLLMSVSGCSTLGRSGSVARDAAVASVPIGYQRTGTLDAADLSPTHHIGWVEC